jgi:hypothetical protein
VVDLIRVHRARQKLALGLFERVAVLRCGMLSFAQKKNVRSTVRDFPRLLQDVENFSEGRFMPCLKSVKC